MASNLRLASLPDDDPALVELRREVERETGIPGALTDTHRPRAARAPITSGSLLKVDRAVDRGASQRTRRRRAASRAGAGRHVRRRRSRSRHAIAFEATRRRRSLLERLEAFLARHTGGDDLGLRLRGEQLAAGVRFVRMVREGTYDLVVANPPYQGTSKMADAEVRRDALPAGQGRPLRRVPAARAPAGARRVASRRC